MPLATLLRSSWVLFWPSTTDTSSAVITRPDISSTCRLAFPSFNDINSTLIMPVVGFGLTANPPLVSVN